MAAPKKPTPKKGLAIVIAVGPKKGAKGMPKKGAC